MVSLTHRKLAALTLAAVAVLASTAAYAAPAVMTQTPQDRDRMARINETMRLSHSNIVRLPVRGGDHAPDNVILLINGAPLITTLTSHSARTDGYRVLVQQDDGSLVEAPPEPVRTLRGQIAGLPDAVVSGSMEEHGLHLRITLPSGDEYWLEPLGGRFADAADDEYILYHGAHLLDCSGSCGLEALPDAAAHRLWGQGLVPLNSGTGSDADEPVPMSAVKIAELACDADYEYFLKWGSVSNVQNRINAIVNSLNAQYEAEVGIRHEITTIIVRTSSNQPYTHKKAENLLNQFRNHWNANHSNIHRDVAHLFTGKSLAGGTIGVAWLGVVCNLSYGYGLSQSDFSANFACVVDLTSHELAHNWNAPHCSCPNHTMNPSITCANTFHPTATIPTIIQFRNSVSCLSNGTASSNAGACCILGSCVQTTQAQCSAEGGSFKGAGSLCSSSPCGCPSGQVQDCNGNCAPASWIGDGICDDGSYAFNGTPIYFNCAEFNCDGGDCVCNGDPGDPGDPGEPGEPVSMSVSQITLSTVNVGQGNKQGRAVVTILNNLGQPVQGATVTGTFSGSYNETHSATTDSQGRATLQTNAALKGNVSFSFCVTNVAHSSLSYAPGDNAVTCSP